MTNNKPTKYNKGKDTMKKIKVKIKRDGSGHVFVDHGLYQRLTFIKRKRVAK